MLGKGNRIYQKKTRQTNYGYATDFFFVNRWMLKCAGLWRPDSKNPKIQKIFSIYSIFTFIFVNLWFTLTEGLALLDTYKIETEFIKNINLFLTHFVGSFKCTLWHLKGRTLKRIMNSLEDPNLQYDGYMEYNPGIISRKYKAIGFRYSFCFWFLAHATLISSYVPPLITTIRYIRTFHCDNETNSAISLPDKLPYYSYIPFPHDTGYTFLIALGWQAGPLFWFSYSLVGMDCLFMNIMNCIAGNVKLVQGALVTVRARAASRLKIVVENSDALNEDAGVADAMNLEMNKIIRHLQIIFKACDDLEQVYRYMCLFQMTATLFILCTSLYLVAMNPLFSKEFVAESVYMTAIFYQLYLYCSFGDAVTEELAKFVADKRKIHNSLQKLPFCLYDCNWLAATNSFKKSIIFTMMRAHRPVYFTAGNFAPLTLTTFMSITKTSYSFFALINNPAP